ncbi:MAG: hypothetical protein ACFFGZ_13500 [Candidatus Thorarchaeota archaeon]
MKYKILVFLSVGLVIAGALATAHAFPPGSGQCNSCHTREHYASCTQCHNSPAYVRSINDTESPSIGAWPEDTGHTSEITGRWTQNLGVWADYRNYSRNYIPIMPSSNQIPPVYPQDPDYNATPDPYNNWIHYVQLQFLKNSSHIIVRARITDSTLNATGNPDMFSIIWNIDADGVTTDFINNNGQMISSTGKLDMWLWDAATVAPNSTGTATDMYIDETHYHDDDSQDVTSGALYGKNFENPKGIKHYGYWIYFARELTTDDPDDVQFKEGSMVEYAIAYWNASRGNDHYSSWDWNLVIGDSLGDSDYEHVVTVTKTESSTSLGFIGVIVSFSFITAVSLVARWKLRTRRGD